MRADRITSVNVRYTMQTPSGGYQQKVDKLFLVPRSKKLSSTWRDHLAGTDRIEWNWRKHPIQLPLGEDQSLHG
eukprot:2478880-Rhodomonas_salina.1